MRAWGPVDNRLHVNDAFHHEVAKLRRDAFYADGVEELRLGHELAACKRVYDLLFRLRFADGTRQQFRVIRGEGNIAFAVHVDALRERCLQRVAEAAEVIPRDPSAQFQNAFRKHRRRIEDFLDRFDLHVRPFRLHADDVARRESSPERRNDTFSDRDVICKAFRHRIGQRVFGNIRYGDVDVGQEVQ